LRSCAFADELNSEVWRNCYPSLPEEGENAQRILWGAAVAIDQLLDEGEIEAAYLAPGLEQVAEQLREGTYPDNGRLYDPDPRVNALASMLADTLADCQHRALDACAYAVFDMDLARMLHAELSSLSATLDIPPVKRVRTIIQNKSALLTWVGFQACSLGQQLDPTEAREYQEICDAIGEILWILDDLIDLEEDLDRGIWNRALWWLYDEVGRLRFREMTGSKAQLAEGIASQGIVAREIDEIAKRLNFLESHPRIEHPQKIRAMLSF
jgi:hypothetical protein